MMLTIFFAIALLSGCQKYQPNTTSSQKLHADASRVYMTTQQNTELGIVTGSSHHGFLQQHITLRGIIDLPPQNRTLLSLPIEATIERIMVLPGMFVRKGQPVAFVRSMRLIELQEQYLTLHIQAQRAEREWRQLENLLPSGGASERETRHAESIAQHHRITLHAVAHRLRLVGIEPMVLSDSTMIVQLPLRAPHDGYVSSIAVITGQSLAPYQPIMELVDVRDMHVVLRAFEREAAIIQPGQELTATALGLPAQTFIARVINTGYVIDSTRSIEVHCHIVGVTPESLRPGMYVTAELAVGKAYGYILPERAVVRWENTHFVVCSHDDGYELVPVEIRGRARDSVAVWPLRSQTFPTRIVIDGAHWILSKLKNIAQE